MTVINLKHYTGRDNRNKSAALKKFIKFLSKIVTIASLTQPESDYKTPILCMRKPARKCCTGKLVIRCVKPALDITWRCPVCNDEGIITNWQGSAWDLSSK